MKERYQDLVEIAARPKHLLRDVLLIFIVSLVLFTAGLAHQEFINFESRFALFAQNMLLTGPTVFPTIFGVPYPDYPAASTFFIYLVSLAAGGVTKFTAVLPSAIAAALTLVIMYLTLAPHSRKWAFCSILFAVFTLFFFTEARTLSLDQYTALVTAFCFYAVYARETFKIKKLIYFIPLALFFGFICRGPIGFIIPAGVVFGFYLFSGQFKRLTRFTIISLLLLIILCALLLACAYHVGGHEFLQRVIMMQVFGRFSPTDNEPFLFYFRYAWGDYAISFPFAFLVTLGYLPHFFKRIPHGHLKLIRHLVIWVLIILIGMSIPGGKKMRYVLAITPALSMIAAYLFVASTHTFWLRCVRHFFTWLFFFFPFICAAILLLARNYAYHHGIHLQGSIHYNTVFILLAILQLIALIYAFTLKNYSKKEVIALCVATLSFVTLNIVIAQRIELQLNNARPFVQHIESLRADKPGPLYFYLINPDGEAIKYFVNAKLSTPPHYISSVQELMQVPRNAYVILDNDDYQNLPESAQKPFTTLLAGNFGREEAIALQKILAKK